MLSNRAPVAGAYWEYLVAYQIVAVLIPQHSDFHDKISGSRSQTHRDYNTILKDISSAEQQFVHIKNIIKKDNLRNGAHHSRSDSASSYMRPDSRNGTMTVPRRDDELMLPSVPTSPPGVGTLPAASADSGRHKPMPQPKPQSLHGRAVHQSSQSINGDLADRFAKLRGAGPPINTTTARSSQDLSVKMPSPADFQSSNRLSGPRDMPLAPSRPPPRLPLDTGMAAAFPKEPSPTYSPARNISLPAHIAPPRSTPRSMNGTGGRSNSLAASSISSHAPNTNGTPDSYFPAQQAPRALVGAPRTRSVSAAIELEIDATKLYDYLRMFNVLVIDVRERSAFDMGHIYHRTIMCLEPSTMQEGDSAEQLCDRLIISPDEEQAMFERRHEYDIVVYYNDSTTNLDFLTKHNQTEEEAALKHLYDTLTEFNLDKPLMKPPILLKGGIDAWIELVGQQALKTSTTAALLATGPTRTRGVRRAPAATQAARLSLQRRRREYVPMDPEEEQKWLEEARKGRAVVEQPPEEEDLEEAEAPFYRTTEEFMRRFPPVEGGQSMVQAAPRPPPIPQYVQPAIPIAPSRPPPSVPRVSYSGVHERQVTPQGRNNQPPVYISQPHFTNVRMHKTGLINFGVTCYMNSVVQCLSAHLNLSDLFLTGRYVRDLQRENWKGTKGILPEAYATLISNLFKGDVASVRPSTFRVCENVRFCHSMLT
jgi:ubiquitin carboxyl-terminal hydrolase 8